MLLGCIADDFTGATDLAGILVRNGMRTVQSIGIPAAGNIDADAVVIALKSRTAPVNEAIAESLAALEYLQAAGAQQFFFKYCSTFDSTAEGNIGPVADALMRELDTAFTYFCPALPENGRTLVHGHLFVGGIPLHESGMQDHPLTPMTDANLVRVLGAQSSDAVGLIDYTTVQAGARSLAEAFAAHETQGPRFAIVDALQDSDLTTIAEVSRNLKLITGGSGIAIGLPQNFRDAGLLGDSPADILPAVDGFEAVVSGSCSLATQGQVKAMAARDEHFFVDPLRLADGADLVSEAIDWATSRVGKGPILAYATSTRETVAQTQSRLGVAEAGALIETALANIAAGWVDLGVRRLVVAGGETSGAVVNRLGVDALRIGPEIAPGVPWTVSLADTPVALALKSGNFGGPDFFADAFARWATLRH
ncbi:MAG: 3-oxo-tetronate kinase [Pseudomonadota bacterium]